MNDTEKYLKQIKKKICVRYWKAEWYDICLTL